MGFVVSLLTQRFFVQFFYCHPPWVSWDLPHPCECCAGSVPALELKVIFDLKTSPCPSAKSRLHCRGVRWAVGWDLFALCAAFRVANGRDGPWRLHFLCQSTVATCSREHCGDISREQIVHQFLNCSLFCLTYLMDLDDFGG